MIIRRVYFYCAVLCITFSLSLSAEVLSGEIDSVFFSGLNEYNKGDFKKAEELFSEVMRNPVGSKIPEVNVMYAKSLKKNGKNDKAKEILYKFLSENPKSQYRDEALTDLTEIFLSNNDYLNAAHTLLNLISFSADPEYIKTTKGYLENIIIDKFSIQEIDSLAIQHKDKKSQSFLTLTKGKFFQSKQKIDEAKEEYFKVIQNYPSLEEHSTAVELYTGQFQSSGKISNDSPIIAIVFPLTDNQGNTSKTAKEVLEGVKFAIHEYNNLTGFRIGLKIFDTKGDIGEIKTIKNEIQQDKRISVILGPLFSEESEIVCEEFKDLLIPQITPTATADNLTETCPYFIQLNPSFEIRGISMAQYIFFVENKKNMVVVNCEDTYSKNLAVAFKNEFKRLGGKIISDFNFKSNETDLNNIFSYLKNNEKKYDGVYLPMSENQHFSLLLSGFSLHGISTFIYGNQDWFNAKELNNYIDLNNRLIITSDYYIDYTSQEYGEMNKVFFEKTNLEVNRNVLYGYDAAKFVLEPLSILNKNTSLIEKYKDPEVIIQGFHNNISLNKNRINRYLNILRYKDNSFEMIDRFKTEEK